MLAFAKRNLKELVRDPINCIFGFCFPVVLILLLTGIQANIPVKLFVIQDLTPGITVFGLSFMTLFSASIIAKDRSSALLQRLYTTPLGPVDFILGYTLPILPLALGQALVCYLVALLLGLDGTVNIVFALLGIIPVSLLFVALGLLCGSVFTEKQVGGICGGLLTNLAGWMAGIWFDLDLVGGTFQQIARLLPFVHGVELEKALLSGDFSRMFPHLWWVLGYGVGGVVLAVAAFLRQMRRQ